MKLESFSNCGGSSVLKMFFDDSNTADGSSQFDVSAGTEMLRERLSLLKYKDLVKKAGEHSIKIKGKLKKDQLVDILVEEMTARDDSVDTGQGNSKKTPWGSMESVENKTAESQMKQRRSRAEAALNETFDSEDLPKDDERVQAAEEVFLSASSPPPEPSRRTLRSTRRTSAVRRDVKADIQKRMAVLRQSPAAAPAVKRRRTSQISAAVSSPIEAAGTEPNDSEMSAPSAKRGRLFKPIVETASSDDSEAELEQSKNSGQNKSNGIGDPMVSNDGDTLQRSILQAEHKPVNSGGLEDEESETAELVPLAGFTTARGEDVSFSETIVSKKSPFPKFNFKLATTGTTQGGNYPHGKPPKVGTTQGLFARQHAMEFSKMKSLDEVERDKRTRHEQNTKGQSNRLQRLATPKQTTEKKTRRALAAQPQEEPRITTGKKPIIGFKFDSAKSDVDTDAFKFGRLDPTELGKVQQKVTPTASGPAKKITPKREQRHGVKVMTKLAPTRELKKMVARVPTVPVVSARLEALATPRNKAQMMQNQGKPPAQLKAIPLRGSRGYTPRTGKLPAFIDTAKMTDYQFDTAKKIGIIKPLSGSRRNIDREETRKALADNRREKRDAVISARRGLLK